ncbi:hypothetical protein [Janthinobacterium sp.]|uniref:hypothetical protein n=1 Tax=Janthinobacterium sp. TaxID=1871054 RepID=UPI0028A0306B|nr:hypothetical protein [Janthinobacterium sp.]
MAWNVHARLMALESLALPANRGCFLFSIGGGVPRRPRNKVMSLFGFNTLYFLCLWQLKVEDDSFS